MDDEQLCGFCAGPEASQIGGAVVMHSGCHALGKVTLEYCYVILCYVYIISTIFK